MVGDAVKSSEADGGMSDREFHAAVRGVDDYAANEEAERRRLDREQLEMTPAAVAVLSENRRLKQRVAELIDQCNEISGKLKAATDPSTRPANDLSPALEQAQPGFTPRQEPTFGELCGRRLFQAFLAFAVLGILAGSTLLGVVLLAIWRSITG